ncbi:hypothetical protein NBRC116494_21400 [Aurantivibrio plasticivorans]
MAIQGLELFKQRFATYNNQFTLIGGVACHLALEEAGLPFRATKDLDIVLCVEVLTPEFANALRAFIEEAGYRDRQIGENEHQQQFYRFQNPQSKDYPFMLELFSRAPDGVILQGQTLLTPIPMGEQAESLSAILLDADYYQCVSQGREIIDEVPILGPEYILPFKAKAWLDLTERREKGEQIDSKNIKKHRGDIFRLYGVLSPQQRVAIPSSIQADFGKFLDAMASEDVLNIKDFGIKTQRLSDVLATLRIIYGLNND